MTFVPMAQFIVCLPLPSGGAKQLDIVYFRRDMTTEDVRTALIMKDGYPDDIAVIIEED